MNNLTVKTLRKNEITISFKGVNVDLQEAANFIDKMHAEQPGIKYMLVEFHDSATKIGFNR